MFSNFHRILADSNVQNLDGMHSDQHFYRTSCRESLLLWIQCMCRHYILCLQDSKSDERFHVELHFSPGVYNVGQNKEYLAGRGYRPQHGEKKQVSGYIHYTNCTSSSYYRI